MVKNLIHFAPSYWLRPLLLSLMVLNLLTLNSCFLFKRKLQVQVKPVERAPLDLPAVPPLQLEGLNWYVVTENNFSEVIAKIKASGSQPVVFSLDERGYESLGINMTKIRGYITQQKAIVAALKNYYNVPDNPESLAPPQSLLTQGKGLGTASVTTPAPSTASAPDSTAKPTANNTPASTGPKKRMAKFIPSFVKK